MRGNPDHTYQCPLIPWMYERQPYSITSSCTQRVWGWVCWIPSIYRHAVQRPNREGRQMSQPWIARELQEHENAIQRHRRNVAFMRPSCRCSAPSSSRRFPAAQAIAQLEEAAASKVELGLAALYRQTIEHLREPREERR